MAFTDFAETQYIKTFDTGESPQLGSFSTTKSTELKYTRVTLYVVGTTAGSEQIRIKIYSDSTYTSLLYTSSWSDINDIPELDGTQWIGWLRIDFNRENLNSNSTYYVLAETNNYTRNAETFYIGLSYDFPFPIYDNAQNLFYNHPLQMGVFGYVDRANQ